MSKQWTPDHLLLAGACETVRAELRRVVISLPEPHRARLEFCLNVLNHGLKARACQQQRRASDRNNVERRGEVSA